MKTVKIAVDGYSSCGKSTLAKQLATALNFVYIDTGAMYRAVTLFASKNDMIDGFGKPDAEELKKRMSELNIEFKRVSASGSAHTFLNGVDVEKIIRGIGVSKNVSAVSTLDFVRGSMVDLQRKMAENQSVIMDGRDIGTVVFPDADLKLFVTADAEVRAWRRYNELSAKGDESVSFEEILENILMRDKTDTTRSISPLKKADDAILFDTSELTIKQQFEKALALIKELPAYKESLNC